eukprot:5477775-Pyramimonas_sp.AAC.2
MLSCRWALTREPPARWSPENARHLGAALRGGPSLQGVFPRARGEGLARAAGVEHGRGMLDIVFSATASPGRSLRRPPCSCIFHM